MTWLGIKYQDYEGTAAALKFTRFLCLLNLVTTYDIYSQIDDILGVFCNACKEEKGLCDCGGLFSHDLDRKYDEYKDNLMEDE